MATKSDKIEMTDRQKEVAGQIMVDAFGANIQSGRYAGHGEWVYVAWQFGPNGPTFIAYIAPDGKVTSA